MRRCVACWVGVAIMGLLLMAAHAPVSAFTATPAIPPQRVLLSVDAATALAGIHRFDDARAFATTGAAPATLDQAAHSTAGVVRAGVNIQVKSRVVNIFGQGLHAPIATDRIKQLAQQFYGRFDESYDFLIIMPDTAVDGEPYGTAYPVRNDVEGIGKPLYDYTKEYGNDDQLRTVVFLNPITDNGPTLHEIMHTWGVPGTQLRALGFGQCTDNSHWGVAGIGRGQLGGFDPATLVDKGNGLYEVERFGTVANGGDTVPYAPIELYLAGFIDAHEAPPMTIPINVDCGSLQLDAERSVMTFRAEGIKTVTMAEVQVVLGVRSPGSATSQKHFTAAMIVVSESPLPSDRFDFFEQWARFVEEGSGWKLLSFGEATGGRGSLRFRIDVPFVPTDFHFIPILQAGPAE